MSIAKFLWSGLVLRAAFIGFAVIQDYVAQVRYTDIDYLVYTDAAESVHMGISPYEGRTALLWNDATKYRYSPIVAYLLIPNITFFADWGKVLFSLCDLVCGYLIYLIVKLVYTPVYGPKDGTDGGRSPKMDGRKSSSSSGSSTRNKGSKPIVYSDDESLEMARSGTGQEEFKSSVENSSPTKDWVLLDEDGKDTRKREKDSMESMASFCALTFLFNPFVFSLSTRGSFDSFVTMFLLIFLWFLARAQSCVSGIEKRKNHLMAAVMYGIVIHLRIVPVVFIVPLFFVVKFKDYMLCGVVAGSVFLLSYGVCYHLYGESFLQEVFLHHLVSRVDSQHNFSIWFYPFWLCEQSKSQRGIGIIKSVAQILQLLAVIMSGCIMWKGRIIGKLIIVGETRSTTEQQLDDASNADQSPEETSPLVMICKTPLWQKMRPYLQKINPLHGSDDKVVAYYVAKQWRDGPRFFKVITMQMLLFVALNRVITAQYFLWFWQFVPLWLPSILSHPTATSIGDATIFWVLGEVHWLLWAYILEFQKQQWARPIASFGSLVFLCANLNLCWRFRCVSVAHKKAYCNKDD